MPETHECPAPGCEKRLPVDTFACRDHWFALPGELRRPLSDLWRRLGRDVTAIDEYIAARDACVAWLVEHLAP